MKQGETGYLRLTFSNLIDIDMVDSIIFTVQSQNIQKTQVQKSWTCEDSVVSYVEGVFYFPMTQKDTTILRGTYEVEAQINYKDKSVVKSIIQSGRIDRTLATTFIEGSTPSEDQFDDIDLKVEDHVSLADIFTALDKIVARLDALELLVNPKDPTEGDTVEAPDSPDINTSVKVPESESKNN